MLNKSEHFQVYRDNLLQFQRLATLGALASLRLNVCRNTLLGELSKFESHWYDYAPNKPATKRFALSITSTDGTMAGVGSLEELCPGQKGSSELDYNQVTEVYNSSTEIQKVINKFLPNIGRSRLVNIKPGGYFPPHRDIDVRNLPDHFRLFLPLSDFSGNDAVFIIDDKIRYLETGRLYFIDTTKIHSVFAYENSFCLMISLPLTHESIDKIYSMLF